MTCRESKIKGVAYSHIEILIDQNLRKDGIVKPLKEWPSAHLLHLYEILMAEVDSREELKVIRADERKDIALMDQHTRESIAENAIIGERKRLIAKVRTMKVNPVAWLQTMHIDSQAVSDAVRDEIVSQLERDNNDT